MKASNWTKHASETRKTVSATVGYRNFNHEPQVALTFHDPEKDQVMVLAMTGAEAKELVLEASRVWSVGFEQGGPGD